MDKLDNIEVFALCVAEIMDELYTAFPIPTVLPASRVPASYEPSQEESQPRMVQPNDTDYKKLLPHGFDVNAGLMDASWEKYSENYNSIEGQPFIYWTNEQREAIRDHRVRAREAERIHKETVSFLVREAYIKDISLSDGKAEGQRESLVLTSKGFAHLNKTFKDGTIRDEFHFHTAKRLVGAIKAGGDIISAGEKFATSEAVRMLVALFNN